MGRNCNSQTPLQGAFTIACEETREACRPGIQNITRKLRLQYYLLVWINKSVVVAIWLLISCRYAPHLVNRIFSHSGPSVFFDGASVTAQLVLCLGVAHKTLMRILVSIPRGYCSCDNASKPLLGLQGQRHRATGDRACK